MKNVLLIGRTNWLLDTANLIQEKGYKIIGIITSKESPESKITVEDLKLYSKKINAVFIHSPKLTVRLFDENFSGLKLDIGISVNYTGIISKEIIDLFEFGILNAHGGDLPKYRGNACQAWAILNAENKIGLCIHKMIGGELDSGNIIAKEYFPINIDTRIGEVYDFFDKKIPVLFLESLRKISQDRFYFLEKQSKNKEEILRCYPRIPEDNRIKWDKSNDAIIRLINASSEPYSGAFCYFKERKIEIWRASICNDREIFFGIPGQVAQILSNGDVIVLTGQGKIIMHEISCDDFRGKPSIVFKSIRSRLI